MNFADRCAIAAGCLPKADYRAKLESLHTEMLAALEAAQRDANLAGDALRLFWEPRPGVPGLPADGLSSEDVRVVQAAIAATKEQA